MTGPVLQYLYIHVCAVQTCYICLLESDKWRLNNEFVDLSYVFSFCLCHKMQAFLLHYFCLKSHFGIINLTDKKQAELFEDSNNRKFPLNWDHERLRAGSQSQRNM